MGHCCSSKQASCSLREAKAVTAPSVYTYVSHQPSYVILVARLRGILAWCGTPKELLCSAGPAKSRATACILRSVSNSKAL